jgi:translation elongation factor EF-G
MAKEFSGFQRKVINDYYRNLDKIALTKLQELVTEIYLAETKEKKSKLWQRVEKALNQLKIPPSIAGHILKQQDPQLLAKNINDWLKSC